MDELRELIKDIVKDCSNNNSSRQNQSSETSKFSTHQNIVNKQDWQIIDKKSKNNVIYIPNEPLPLSNRFKGLPNHNSSNDIHLTVSNNSIGSDVLLNRDSYKSNRQTSFRRENVRTANNISTNRRPSLVVNNHPENQHVFKTVPGNRTYSDITKKGKDIKIFADSIPRCLRMNEFNRFINSGKAYLKAFPGAKASRIHHYIIPTLIEETPDIVILHVGCNDLSPKNNIQVNVDEIANEIINTGKTCCQHGVEKVFISSIICSNNNRKQIFINKLNDILEEKCATLGFTLLFFFVFFI